MSKQEIRVTQTWRERDGKQRTGTVRWFTIGGRDDSPQTVRLTITAPNKPGIRDWLDIGVKRLRENWECLDPPAPRQIRLTLAKDTTATECGNCECVTEREQCGAFGQKDLDNSAEGAFLRLPECIAAEVRP